MKEIIIAYPIKETALQLRAVLYKNGIHAQYVCATGATVLGIAAELHGGLIICASILRDMSVGTLANRLPAGFDIIALNKSGIEEYMGNIISLPLPLDVNEFIKTVEILISSRVSFTDRNASDADIISNAKTILMGVNEISEMQAHKYIQQLSMKQSKPMVDVAKEIIENFS